MDGNGRWAKKRGLPRIMGHRSGVQASNTVIEACARSGIKALTLYAFSAENWKRPRKEVDALMALIEQTLKKNMEKMKRNNIKFNVIGRLDDLPRSLQDAVGDFREETSANTGMILTVALSYGGRQEILDAVKAVCGRPGGPGMDISSWSEEDFEKFLYTAGLPDPDLIIRTSGEMRLSNFLLWQSAYSEFYVTDVLWPDFNAAELEIALEEYAGRDRRFGE
ncbi:MAG: isoprenyl transferase [Candidatus Makaraimicrobium thalassicum]|nr:MAG: isoprenyl transferase [Candidatus Omnitrophota bacterium]